MSLYDHYFNLDIKKETVLILNINNRQCLHKNWFWSIAANESESSISCQAAIGLSAKFSYRLIKNLWHISVALCDCTCQHIYCVVLNISFRLLNVLRYISEISDTLNKSLKIRRACSHI